MIFLTFTMAYILLYKVEYICLGLGGAASALIHFKGLVTDVVDCFNPLFVGLNVKV